jgi:hypothetical protein
MDSEGNPLKEYPSKEEFVKMKIIEYIKGIYLRAKIDHAMTIARNTVMETKNILDIK